MDQPSTIDDDTQYLTRAIAKGDTDAFSTLYDRHFDALLSIVRKGTGRDDAFCLDVVQLTFMKVIRSIPVLQSRAQLEAWLRRTALRTALDELRKERRRSLRERTPLHQETVGEQDDERLRWLERQIASLPKDEAELLIARFRFGRTLDRIAKDLGLRPGAVHGRLARLLARLRAASQEESS